MAGVKGRSGRRTKYEEVHINELAGMSVRWAEENWKKLPHADKLKVLLALGPKYVVQTIKGEGFGTDVYNLITQIQSDVSKNRNTPLVLDSGNGVDKRRT